MMYRLNPQNVDCIIQCLELVKKYRLVGYDKGEAILNDNLEQFKSIQLVMGMTNQDYVYIAGRDPNKL